MADPDDLQTPKLGSPTRHTSPEGVPIFIADEPRARNGRAVRETSQRILTAQATAEGPRTSPRR